MIYKRFITACCLFLCFAGNILAQDTERNAEIATVFNNLTYVKKEAKASVGSVLGTIADVLVGNQITQEEGRYEEALRASVVKGLSQAIRIAIMDGSGLL